MLELARLPCSAALALAAPAARWALQAAGGDDYELCFTAPATAHAQVLAAGAGAGVAVHCIGHLQAGQGVHWRDRDGQPWQPAQAGYQHFQHP